MHSTRSHSVSETPWLSDYLAEKGFQRTAPATFSNGRATLILQGTVLRAIPGEGTKVWKSELHGVSPDSVRGLLDVLLAAPPFWSQKEVERRQALRTDSLEALDRIVDTIRQSPESLGGRRLRQFLWSIFNQHHVVNLWGLKDELDPRSHRWVADVFNAWTHGYFSEDDLRRALTIAGEMERWDSFNLQIGESDQLRDALNAVIGLLKTIPPSAPAVQLTRARQVLLETRDSLRMANKGRTVETQSGVQASLPGGKE